MPHGHRHALGEGIDPASIYAIDGDTLAYGNERVRLMGYDTPETYQARCDFEKALGDAATMRLRDLITSGGLVDLTILPGRDRFGRLLGRLSVNGRDVGNVLVSEGLARPYSGGAGARTGTKQSISALAVPREQRRPVAAGRCPDATGNFTPLGWGLKRPLCCQYGRAFVANDRTKIIQPQEFRQHLRGCVR